MVGHDLMRFLGKAQASECVRVCIQQSRGLRWTILVVFSSPVEAASFSLGCISCSQALWISSSGQFGSFYFSQWENRAQVGQGAEAVPGAARETFPPSVRVFFTPIQISNLWVSPLLDAGWLEGHPSIPWPDIPQAGLGWGLWNPPKPGWLARGPHPAPHGWDSTRCRAGGGEPSQAPLSPSLDPVEIPGLASF